MLVSYCIELLNRKQITLCCKDSHLLDAILQYNAVSKKGASAT